MGRNSRRSVIGVLSVATLLGVAARAQAYCLTRTCDPNAPDTAPNGCQYEHGCATSGLPISWPNACVAFSVQQAGSPRRQISYADFDAVVSDALYEWSHVDCGGGSSPSIQLFDRSPVACSRVEYNPGSKQPNANLWMFQDAEWPHPGTGTLALTTVTFNPSTAEIYDADVEINSAQNRITVGDSRILFDLKSIVIHEAGHTLGLAHSPVTYATMFSSYDPADVTFRTLSTDDAQGICAVYPPGQTRGACDPTPRHGFSSACAAPERRGCAFTPPRATGGWGLGAIVGAGLLGSVGLGLRRRRQRS